MRFFLTGVTETAHAAIRQARDLMELRETFRARLSDKPRAIALLDELFVNPYVTVGRATQRLGVSDPTARQAVQVLQERGILEEISGRAWRRLYVARPILRILEHRTEDR